MQHGPAAWTGRLGSAAAAAALALYGALQAVDGVALKHAVDAWAEAPDAEKDMRFAAAEDIRWMEWGVRSYQSFMLGIALILAWTGWLQVIAWRMKGPDGGQRSGTS